MDFLTDFIVGTLSYEFLHPRFWDKFLCFGQLDLSDKVEN
ncbi:hypothetical protein LEP1GSC103_3088 [Leptospira borgpetersenii serovar Javanica str. UI 09931]|uniref:Uncharacterized protein n=5 Tax=Leptospira borgpetersenii TaxID=174 RepID=M3GG93_LEPBO|nr:hypothetical protein LBBP_01968 [Leptospira borgpetersenii serovar Ballum]EKP14218.1 hypothetical protein LEP1GSC128_2993 [Leptospira borgpetersenii str. 200801926]EKQ92151.1 hypothetical protein LEP1GSC101_3426 [Leptospira borgpetersenii str. UI 09149]EKR01874.1 hypothetical protein LEP1GSC121_3926 [Leptospira borgpetersenii serovar Castellonis str. 200801910]EMF99986.1 hypothetical protein LEP1GSC123_4313 [Leptospira borgpetersenii str. 200701203]EMK10310.1 hypothetical protein LEP1GSC066